MRLIPIICLFFSLFSQAGESAPPLRVGMVDEFSPMAFRVAGELQGIEVDLAHIVSERLGRPPQIDIFAFDELIVRVADGTIDVAMSGLSVTAKRRELVEFTEPFLQVGQMAIVRVPDVQVYVKPGAMAKPGTRIGVQRGGTGEAFVRGEFKHALVTAFPGVESGLQALRDGEVDVFVHDSTTSWQLGRSFVNDNLLSLNRHLTEEKVAWAVHPASRELITALNLILKEIKSDGTLNEVLSRWLPEYKPI